MHDTIMRSLLCAVLLILLPLPARSRTVAVPSPDGRIVFTLVAAGDGSGTLRYTITWDGRETILPSRLGVITADLPSWDAGLTIGGITRQNRDTTWQPVYGERAVVRDHFTGATVVLTRAADTSAAMHLEIRVYNEGAAFRYTFPERLSTSVVHVAGEATSFTFPEGTMAYVTPFAQELYHRVPLRDWSFAHLPLPLYAAPTPEYESERPLTLALPDGRYAAIGEAGLVDFARMKFVLATDEPNCVRTRLFGTVTASSPFATPWRFLMLAGTPGELLEQNDLVLNLNEPCAITETGWIRPGTVMREVTLSTAGARETIDFCAAHGIDYIEFDAGWYGYEYTVDSDASRVDVDPRRNPKKDLDLPAVLAYARERNVGVWLYVNHRALERQIDHIFPLYRTWGVAGIKFGFVHVGSHRWTRWLHEAVRKAAENRLMVDIHDEYRPTGVSRTWPNLLTQEGVHGNECMPEAVNSTILPFTRFLAGAADHTICYYHQPGIKNVRGIKTTSAHQLALSVIYYSPLQFIFWYDRPSDHQGEPEVEFFHRLPTVWDTTKVLIGEIGTAVAMARRKADRWYIGAVTNNDARSVSLPLSFTGRGTTWVAAVYTDGGDAIRTRTKVRIDRWLVDAGTTIRTDLLPSGGMAMILRPATPEDRQRYTRYTEKGQ